MLAYAQWLAQEPEAHLAAAGRRGVIHPCRAERTARANFFARRKIETKTLIALEQRTDFGDYFRKLQEDAQFQVREMMVQDLTLNVQARRVALERAADLKMNEDGSVEMGKDGRPVFGPMVDVKEVRQLTEFVPALAFPKRVEPELTAPRITIHIGSREAKALIGKVLAETEEEVSDVEYEVVEPEPIEEDNETRV
jgi:hypothetical protein